MSGNLSHQIEHHLFPDLPANRYPEMATEVRELCQKYGLPYNTGGLFGQLSSTWKKIARLSLPNGWFRGDDELVVHIERNTHKEAATTPEPEVIVVDERGNVMSPASGAGELVDA